MRSPKLSPSHYWLIASLLILCLLFLVLLYPEGKRQDSIALTNLPQAIQHQDLSPPSASLWTAAEADDTSAAPPQPPLAPLPVEASIPSGGALLIILDDMGENLDAARTLLRLPYAVVLSIWPFAHHAEQTARLAHAAGREIFIHLPMEPRNFPRMNPGPHALFCDTSPQAMAKIVNAARHRLPHAVGINNHMGSRFTSNAQAVANFCRTVAGSGLVVLDSVTHPTSLLYTTARKAGLPSLMRHVFLDNVRHQSSILAQLEQAEQRAQKEGLIVAIGHPYPQTLAALNHWRPKGVALVSLRQLFGPPAF